MEDEEDTKMTIGGRRAVSAYVVIAIVALAMFAFADNRKVEPPAEQPTAIINDWMSGLVCDTEVQMRAFANRWDGQNGPEIISELSQGLDGNTCAVGTFAVTKMDFGEVMAVPTGSWQIVELEIVGYEVAPEEGVMFNEPIRLWTIIEAGEVKDPAVEARASTRGPFAFRVVGSTIDLGLET